jgi:SAM-dependent methyltransferase
VNDRLDSHGSHSFGGLADEYSRVRFSVPETALDWLLAGNERRVLDLGAGTGQASGALAALGLDVVAVEPDGRMLDQLRARLPGVEGLAGSAESIPLPSASVDAVVVSNAWHWFDPRLAALEISRVLRDHGRLCVAGTSVDVKVAWVRRLYSGEALSRRLRANDSHRLPVLPDELFAPAEAAVFDARCQMSPQDIIALFRTFSFYRMADDRTRRLSDERVRGVIVDLFPGAEHVSVPTVTGCWRAQRLARPGGAALLAC